MAPTGSLTFTDLSGGRNGVDSPISASFPMNQTVEALNMDLSAAGCGEKRLGSYEYTNHSTGGTAFTTAILALFTKTASPTATELWAIDWAATPIMKRSVLGSGTWSDVTLSDNVTVSAATPKTNAVTLNDKLFIAYPSGVDRLHVQVSGNTVRRVGITTPAPPTVANTGGGAYPATLRYYRIRYFITTSGGAIAMSEPSTSVAFTPSGGGTAARVTKGASPGDSEDSWRIEASSDNVTFYVVTDLSTGTTFYDDSTTVANYPGGELSEPAGFHYLWPNMNALATDGNRLLGIVGSKLYYSPVLGTSVYGDDERLILTSTRKPFLELNAKDGGDLTAISRPLNGIFYVFKARQTWRITATGIDTTPYVARKISDTVGSMNPKCVCSGEDAAGNPVTYTLCVNGVFRIGADGIQYCARDVEDLTKQPTKGWVSNINANATTASGHLIYASGISALLVWFTSISGAGTTPEKLLVCYVKRATQKDQYGVRGGWVQWNGAPATANCSAAWGSLDNTNDEFPWIGSAAAPKVYQLLNSTAAAQDEGTNYQAYLKTRHVVQNTDLERRLASHESILTMTTLVGAGGTFRQTIDRDLGTETRTADATLSTATSLKIEGSEMSEAFALQFQWGDAAAANQRWRLAAATITLFGQGDR